MDWLLGGVGGALFDYNRENFFFDKEQHLKREFQGLNMKVKQFELYRADIRDLIDLTVSKMDNYMIVNAILLTFCITLLTEGRPEGGGHRSEWVHWLYGTCATGSIFFTLLSMWLAMHASIAAHSFGVRMLTQMVRLPVPSSDQLDAATATGQDYERQGAGEMFRVPVLQQRLRQMRADADSEAGDDLLSETEAALLSANGVGAPASNLPHMKLYRELQANWQAYDAYARVCMAMGANQLLHAVSYYVLRMLVSEEHSPWPALACLCIMTFCAYLLARLDLYLEPNLLMLGGFLLLAPPAITMVVISIDNGMGADTSIDGTLSFDLCGPVTFLLHMMFIGFMLYVGTPTAFNGVSLPTRFRGVLYLDVFGWLTPSNEALGNGASAAARHGDCPRMQAELSMVAEEGGGDPAEQEAGDFAMVRQRSLERRANTAANLRAQLGEVCSSLQDQLAKDFQRWSNEEVASMISDDQCTLKQIKHLHERFDAISARLEGALPDLSPAGHGGGKQDAAEEVTTWLKLEWNPSGAVMYYFYCCERKQTTWTMPKEPDRVSTIESLEAAVDGFAAKVQELADFRLPEREREDEAESTEPPRRAAHQARDADATGEALLQRTASIEVQTFGRVDGVAAEQSPTGMVNHEHSALPVGLASTDNFHPHRIARDGVSHGGRARRPPGQMPWRTFYQGCIVMIIMWGCRLAWAIYNLIDDTFGAVGEVAPEDILIYAGAWPAPFFDARGMSCGGDKLWLAEQYRVHSMPMETLNQAFLRVDRRSSAHLRQDAWQITANAWHSAVESCLQADEDFRMAGIRDVKELCEPAVSGESQRQCSLFLLSTSGSMILRCDLSNEPTPQSPSPGESGGSGPHVPGPTPGPGSGGPTPTPEKDPPSKHSTAAAVPKKGTRYTLEAGPYGSLAVVGEALPDGWGATRLKDGVLVWFKKHPSRENTFVPDYNSAGEGTHPAPGRYAELLPGGVYVTVFPWNHAFVLSASRLRAPDVDPHDLPEEWRKDLPKDLEWRGLCVSESYAYLLGVTTRRGEAYLVRYTLPLDTLLS